MGPATQRVNIQSKDHERLLNVIDDLRSQGISHMVDLPQIIVVGDQSSGKSSVLEAVSGLTFPAKDALCTRFATELILRRSEEVNSSVSIVPDANRSDAEKQELIKNFKNDGDVWTDLASIVDSAGEAMGLDSSKKFSTDVLRIELTGPTQPHLTLVDLPGLFHSGSKTQSDADAASVRALVTSYMEKSRSIMLAVISALNDVNNQIVISLAKTYDKDGERTLGIITKPDTLKHGSDMEKQFIELAENKDVHFQLGWHVLRNRDYDERNCTNAERDTNEKKFFAEGIWTSLSPGQLGVDTLRPRLAEVLQGQILTTLPSLLSDVQAGIKVCESRLERLGTSRGTIDAQRQHLHAISEAFTGLVKEAVGGTYNSDYFGNPATDDGYLKRICAIVTNKGHKFRAEMTRRGHRFEVVETIPEKQSRRGPIKLTEQERLSGIRALVERNRGKELATVVKEETITALFKDQSSPWESILKKCASDIFGTVRSSVYLALDATSDEATLKGILTQVINPAFAAVKADFDKTVQSILYQHIHGHPVTWNHYLTEILQNARKANEEDRLATALSSHFGVDPRSSTKYTTTPVPVNTKALLQALMKVNERDMTTFACLEALALMEAYYKVALKNVVDDFAEYAVQQNLLNKVETLFPPSTIFKLEEGTIEDIAGETEESKKERALYTRKLGALRTALDILQQLDRGRAKTFKITALSSKAAVGSDETLTDSDTEVDSLDGEDAESE